MKLSAYVLSAAVLLTVAGLACATNEKLNYHSPCKWVDEKNGKKWDLSVLTIDSAGADSLDRNYKATDGQYNYFINVCTSVNGYNGDENPAVLQEEKTAQSGKDKRQVVLGQADEAGIKSYTYQSSTDISDTDLVFTYPEGAVSDHKCPGETRAARIIYVCDDVGVGSPRFAYEADNCEYVFLWITCAACDMSNPIRQACPAKSSRCLVSSKLSSGAVFLIVVLSLVSFYVVVGMLYNRFVNGAKGLDQCPNIDMWMGLLENVQAGCLYICKCQRPQKTNISYQGLDISDDEDDDDDNQIYS